MGIKRLIKNYIKAYRLKKAVKKADYELLSFEEIVEKLHTLPQSQNPKVSIIIPVYNQINYTLNCLYSIGNAKENTSFEIIIVNDCSTDNSEEVLKNIKGIRLVKNSENSGFLKSVNHGINNALGEYIYLLNNDTIVQPGFLDTLVDVMETKPDAGAVGSKLIYPNHILQEAGCLIYKDRHIVNLGRNQSPDNPEYNFLKKVDYCSGCSLLFRKINSQGEINLLDEIYAPAYYEETDFCMRLKYEQNLQVYYQPLSVIVHFENVSHQNEAPSSDKTRLMEKNSAVFYERWGKHFTEPMILNQLLNIDKNSKKPSILFVETYFPKFDNDSGANRIVEIMKYLTLHDHKVFLITMNEESKDESYIKLYESYGIHILRGFVNEKAEIITQKIQLKNLNTFIDQIWISRIETYHYFVQHYMSLISKKTMIYDMVDFQYLRIKREIELGLNTMTDAELKMAKEREMSAINNSNKVIAISETEKDFLTETGIDKNKVHVISNIHELKEIDNKPHFNKRSGVLFIGGGKHNPNIDAIIFLHEIMKIVWQKRPDISVDIIGGDMPDEIIKLDSDHFKIRGFVKVVSTYFTNAILTVAPLRYGAGVKGKIGQALEFSLPVVTTTIGAEGMHLENEDTAMIAEISDKEKLAADIIRLHEDENLWTKLSDNSSKAIYPFTINGQKKEIFNLFS
ncbi:glycosyltransferase [Chryseobacterium caseinilyticum]|uniref:Glycosyltransferase n=1 Tax=Chryseobacterium caseinilyticum TaxID=2771428 RepID=A0ABR8ZEL0_9FLAO|nr:glycosyltransferase [Chryseobacterium caseinilyticum]MBD8083735.1 glycosyltransferase [Chryseobacterium caseinilyticum]